MKIKLNRIEPHGHTSEVWPLKIVAEGTDITSAIFVMSTGPAGEAFECISSVAQLSEIPESTPTVLSETSQIPYYRKAEAVFTCRSLKEREYIWNTALGQVQTLVDELGSLERLTNTTKTVTLSPA